MELVGEEGKSRGKRDRGRSRMPQESIFYDRVVPALLIGLGILMAILILIALGVLLGIVPTG